jgi:phosphate transport system substrate-binding protein
MANLKKNNDMAVSPIVATLVLIVVAVIGAVAVGTIMGTFSSDVSKQANTGQASSAAQTDILIAGSTTIQPAMNLIAADYMAANPQVHINVQGGGSGAGLSAIANGVADIGMFSQAMDTKQLAAYPNVHQYTVGYGGVVPIINSGGVSGLFNKTANVSTSDLEAVFANDYTGAVGTTFGITSTVVRSDVSGTADSFATLIGAGNIYAATNSTVSAQNGNGALVTQVKATAHSIGFTDLDYALTATGIQILDYTGTQPGAAYDYKGVRDAENGVANTQNFPKAAVRPLELLTNGPASSTQNNIIQFVQSPNEAAQFHSINLVHISDIVTL